MKLRDRWPAVRTSHDRQCVLGDVCLPHFAVRIRVDVQGISPQAQVIVCVLFAPGGSMAGRVDVNIAHQRLTYIAHFDEELQVAALKDMLAVHTGVPPEQQSLCSEELHDLEVMGKSYIVEMVPLMSVNVVNMSGDILLHARMEPWLPFSALKVEIHLGVGHPVEMQRLLLGNMILRNDVVLGDVCRIFEVRPGDQLRVQLILSGVQ